MLYSAFLLHLLPLLLQHQKDLDHGYNSVLIKVPDQACTAVTLL